MLSVDVEKTLGEFSLAAKFQTAGGVTALFGPSGSGKTSIVNMIAGLVTPDRGRIALDDAVLFDSAARTNVPPHKRRIGYVFQEGRLFPHLTVAQNLDYGRWMHGLPADAAERERIIALLDIAHLLPRRPGKLSGGERQRVAFGRALLMQPRLLLLDEPTAGMNPTETAEMMEIIRALKQRGLTILLIEHKLELVMQLSDRVVVMDHGARIAEGAPRAVASDPAVIEAYLGHREVGRTRAAAS